MVSCDLQRRRAAKARRIRSWGFGSGGRFQACRFRCASSRSRPSMTTWIMKRELCTWVLPPPLGVETDPTSRRWGEGHDFSGISRKSVDKRSHTHEGNQEVTNDEENPQPRRSPPNPLRAGEGGSIYAAIALERALRARDREQDDIDDELDRILSE
jgi:hypothetical protein